MGNSQTKETRSSLSQSSRRHHPSAHSSSRGRSPYGGRYGDSGNGPDLSFLGIGGSSDRHAATLEHRRETKQEREARRLEKERVARVKERERSMKEEHVDGGYLVTQGVYVGTEDFNKAVVRRLMIERRLAPFWRGLNDFSESWIEHQLVAAARGLPIPPPDEVPPELECKFPNAGGRAEQLERCTLPITSRSRSYNSDGSQSPAATQPVSGTSSTQFRSRAKTLASLTTSLKSGSQVDLAPREIQLPRDPFVNGQPIEAYLYKNAVECPICFLYYPPYLNRTRCCDQPICSECFVQIKRPDPHPPEHGETDRNSGAEGDNSGSSDCQLVSEPSACPFCVQPEFGVTYTPPPFRRGLAHALDPNARLAMNATSSASSTSSLPPGDALPTTGRRRGASLSANDPAVVTTDKIRPDWAQKLSNARAQASRRAAAATALHTAAYLMNSNGSDSRFGLGRRSGARRTGRADGQGSAGRSGSPALNALAFLTERRHEADYPEEESGSLAPPRGSSRRTRIDDLEEMMMMEAVRLSLASEEERRKRVEKEARKDAKKREKDAKKADKVSRRNGLLNNNAGGSASDASAGSGLKEVASSSSSVLGDETTSAEKGKGVDRVSPSATTTAVDQSPAATSSNTAKPVETVPINTAERSSPSDSGTQPSPAEPSKQSCLRNVSSASSSFSSLVEQNADERVSPYSSADGSSASLEPMFNFRSLAAMIGDEDKPTESAEHTEEIASKPEVGSSASSFPSDNQSPPRLPQLELEHITPLQESMVSQENRECLIPKELETSSIEITNATPNAEATS
ncbi:SNF1-interacting protein [Monascus purpureus]|uniref:Protein SIP5 n=1 Tax=Monascus purpureus TaxID=5098 RepID=A0A507R0E5_MONPU|nr:SNF1-interacting protein [Monascus purpureus]BDD57896.1 SNF1-interacting protein [Monascus purpureus]